MNFVPHRFRNVINPWQTPKDIHSATMFILKMISRESWIDWDYVLNSNNHRHPLDRRW